MVTPLLSLTELEQSSPLAHIVFNTNVRILEAHSRHILQSVALTAPPGSPSESAVYFIAATATGSWAGHDGQITVYIQGAWYFLGAPATGERWYSAATTAWVQWSGSAWT